MNFFKTKDSFFGFKRWERYLCFFCIILLSLLPMCLPIVHCSGVLKIIFSLVGYLLYCSASITAFCLILKKNDINKKAQVGFAIVQILIGVILAVVANFAEYKFINNLQLAFYPYIIGYLLYMAIDLVIFTGEYIREKLIRTIFVLSIYMLVWGIILRFINKIMWAMYFVKIAIGIIYLSIILTLCNSIFYKKQSLVKEEIQQTLYYKVALIIVYLVAIFTIPLYVSWWGLNVESFEYFITIYASAIGGIITLAGVAWTIKATAKEKEEEEIKKAKPVVFITDYRTINFSREKPVFKQLLSEKQDGTLKKATEKDESYSIPQIFITNSDYSYVTLRGFMINDDVHFYDYGQVLQKNSFMQLTSSFKFKYKKKIKYVSLILEDMLDNLYEMKVEFNISGETKDKTITILSVLKTERLYLEGIPND